MYLMRQSLTDKYGILKLQNTILIIAKYMHDFCKEHSINYCLMGGSALGAIRHKGFIPWDDDLDIFMQVGDYMKFRQLFLKQGDKQNFYLQEWGACDGMVTLAKLRLNGTSLIERDLADWNMHHGVYIDIFILHTCPDNFLLRLNQFIWAKYLVTKGAANRNYKKKGLLGFLIQICRLFPRRFLVKFALTQVYKYTNRQSMYFSHFLGRAGLRNGLYKREYFEKSRLQSFETIELCVPHQCEAYLKDRWGDYMIIPPYEETLKYKHSWKWSVSNSFPGFNTEGTYRDEPFLLA